MSLSVDNQVNLDDQQMPTLSHLSPPQLMPPSSAPNHEIDDGQYYHTAPENQMLTCPYVETISRKSSEYAKNVVTEPQQPQINALCLKNDNQIELAKGSSAVTPRTEQSEDDRAQKENMPFSERDINNLNFDVQNKDQKSQKPSHKVERENKMQQVIEKFQKIETKYGVTMQGTEKKEQLTIKKGQKITMEVSDSNMIRDQIEKSNPNDWQVVNFDIPDALQSQINQSGFDLGNAMTKINETKLTIKNLLKENQKAPRKKKSQEKIKQSNSKIDGPLQIASEQEQQPQLPAPTGMDLAIPSQQVVHTQPVVSVGSTPNGPKMVDQKEYFQNDVHDESVRADSKLDQQYECIQEQQIIHYSIQRMSSTIKRQRSRSSSEQQPSRQTAKNTHNSHRMNRHEIPIPPIDLNKNLALQQSEPRRLSNQVALPPTPPIYQENNKQLRQPLPLPAYPTSLKSANLALPPPPVSNMRDPIVQPLMLQSQPKSYDQPVEQIKSPKNERKNQLNHLKERAKKIESKLQDLKRRSITPVREERTLPSFEKQYSSGVPQRYFSPDGLNTLQADACKSPLVNPLTSFDQSNKTQERYQRVSSKSSAQRQEFQPKRYASKSPVNVDLSQQPIVIEDQQLKNLLNKNRSLLDEQKQIVERNRSMLQQQTHNTTYAQQASEVPEILDQDKIGNQQNVLNQLAFQTQGSYPDLSCTHSEQSTKREGQWTQKIDNRAIEALRRKIKAKECEFNILTNQKTLLEIEAKADIKKQARTIAKLKKEQKSVISQVIQVNSDNSRLTEYLTETNNLLTEADKQQHDMQKQLEDLKNQNSKIDQQDLDKQIKNVEAIIAAENYLDKLETQNKELTEKNTVQREEITRINQELEDVLTEMEQVEDAGKLMREQRRVNESKLENTNELPDTMKKLRVQMSLLDQEESYIQEEINRITNQNSLMEKDKEELTNFRDKLQQHKDFVDKNKELNKSTYQFSNSISKQHSASYVPAAQSHLHHHHAQQFNSMDQTFMPPGLTHQPQLYVPPPSHLGIDQQSSTNNSQSHLQYRKPIASPRGIKIYEPLLMDDSQPSQNYFSPEYHHSTLDRSSFHERDRVPRNKQSHLSNHSSHSPWAVQRQHKYHNGYSPIGEHLQDMQHLGEQTQHSSAAIFDNYQAHGRGQSTVTPLKPASRFEEMMTEIHQKYYIKHQ